MKKYFIFIGILVTIFFNGCGGGSSTTPSSNSDTLTVKSVEVK